MELPPPLLDPTPPRPGAPPRAAPAGEPATGDPAARRTAEAFEAMFLAEMLAPMFESLETDGLFGGGSGEKIYRAMLVQEYARTIARAGGVGIADAVQREIIKLQENQP